MPSSSIFWFVKRGNIRGLALWELRENHLCNLLRVVSSATTTRGAAAPILLREGWWTSQDLSCRGSRVHPCRWRRCLLERGPGSNFLLYRSQEIKDLGDNVVETSASFSHSFMMVASIPHKRNEPPNDGLSSLWGRKEVSVAADPSRGWFWNICASQIVWTMQCKETWLAQIKMKCLWTVQECLTKITEFVVSWGMYMKNAPYLFFSPKQF